MRFIVRYFLVAFTGVALAHSPVTMVSNLGQPANSSQLFGSAFGTHMSVAGSFRTGNTPGLLATISIQLFGATHPNGGLTFCDISFYGDSAGQPGSSLATLAGQQFPLTPGIYTYTNTSPLMLAPNTAYWVVASSPNSFNDAFYSFALVPTTNTDPGSVWTIGEHKYKIGSDNWASGPAYGQIAVTAIPQPPPLSVSWEPGAPASRVVLTYPSPDVPFTLQQNSDLASANWVSVTNGVVVTNNSTIKVSVPALEQRMFFRLR